MVKVCCVLLRPKGYYLNKHTAPNSITPGDLTASNKVMTGLTPENQPLETATVERTQAALFLQSQQHSSYPARPALFQTPAAALEVLR